MSQSIAACYMAICASMFLASHHDLEKSVEPRLHGLPGTGPALRTTDRFYGLLDQLIFLIPGYKREGSSMYMRGRPGRSGQVLTDE